MNLHYFAVWAKVRIARRVTDFAVGGMRIGHSAGLTDFARGAGVPGSIERWKPHLFEASKSAAAG